MPYFSKSTQYSPELPRRRAVFTSSPPRRFTRAGNSVVNPGYVNRKGKPYPILSFADTEYFSATAGTGALGGRSLVLQGGGLGVLHFNFLSAFHAISLHRAPPYVLLA
jgi:hypothetical protein